MAEAFDNRNSGFILTLVLFILAGFVEAQSGYLPQEEVNALGEIADQLGKKDWNLSVNSCNQNNSNFFKWNATNLPEGSKYNNSVLCNCSNPIGICHIQSMFLKGQDLDGILPPSIAKLPHIKQIDFTRNYLHGTIPREWATTKLESLAVTVNRLSGPIPEYLGNISTLTNVSLDNNMFTGSIPPELGRLVNLKSLHLDANYLNGHLPLELNNLINLQDIRLSNNNFTGNLPDFQMWKNLNKIDIQAGGFEGPLPSSFSLISNLTDLLISNLNGGASEFPQLERMVQLKNLVLRSCNISGEIPKYLSQLTKLQRIDLSFNKLEGELQTDLSGLESLRILYLTNNSLTGKIPEWIKSKGPKGEHNNCLGSPSCSKDLYAVHINCGGNQVTIGNRTFEADEDLSGQAKYYYLQGHWGYSSTGFFYKIDESLSLYTAKNNSILRMNDSELYTSARLSPLSLTYYGRCLANGNYTVTLHFAEIVFRDNSSYQSLGRRVFDIYVQDELRLKDYDIEHEAHGVDKAVKPKIKAVVMDKTLQVRFVYSGKGTTAVPVRGTYGPLISAISMESDNPPQDSSASHRKQKIIISVSVVVLGLFLLFTSLGIAWWQGYIGNRILKEEVLRGLDLQTGVFTFQQIKAATDNFAAANKIGEGGFGSVYKGVLLDGTIIAVKQLSSKSNQGSREFVNEIGMISGLGHPNLVRLHGCCTEHKQLLLVYEFMENNSLARALFDDNYICLLDWACNLKENGNLMELIDPRLGSEYNIEEAIRMIKVALLCTNTTPALRPTMSCVVSMLSGDISI
uniref:non-specific serine/threonine protein kinase n=1 Tax=Daucus carota subsp. sativus TaxID=79200 RepID=A0A175YMD3_DAUCS